MGHSDIKMTMRYMHLAPSHLRKAVASLDSSPYNSHQTTDGRKGGEIS
jgi:hypothetical protein